MRTVPASMTERWQSQAKIGDQRPVVRATIQKGNLKRFDYDTAWANGGSFDTDRHRTGQFTSMVFGDLSQTFEIRNIKSVSWKRSVDQDVATCELTLLNAELTPLGNPTHLNPTDPVDLDQPGYYTYNRGDESVSVNRWGYGDETGWNGVFVPDRIVRTYEGYGSAAGVAPALDENLVQSGTWLIDKVSYNADATITLEMRDFGRLLLDQIVFPPVVPRSEYPLTWSRFRSENVAGRDASGGSWEQALRAHGDATSSNAEYIGAGLSDPPFGSYVTRAGGWNGHHPRHALEANDSKWWVSTGQSTRDSFVWWQYNLDSAKAIAAIRLHLKGGPCRVYISVHNGSKWLGKRKIPYEVTTEGINNGSKIPYLKSIIADRASRFDVTLPRVVRNAKKIRITFTRLVPMYIGNYPWRAGLRDMAIYTGAADSLDIGPGRVLKVVGNYGDYTQIIKWVCAWGGFFWPPHATGLDFQKISRLGQGALLEYISYAFPDQTLPKGRVWGDFMRSGTVGQADLTVDQFDKKPLMDIVNYVRDLLGFIFFIDETGGVVWRMPNLGMGGNPKLGNYLSPGHLEPRTRSRTSSIITLDEEDTLLEYSTVLDSSNIRERIFVANVVGKVGTVIKGFNPYPTGLRRVAGWSDQNFETKRETRVMADMISARQMFSWKRGTAVIPGYPAIQIDDQIRIFERITNESYYHYVRGIASELDMETGVWTYSLETHWLGEDPSDAWVVKVEELAKATKNYLARIGYEPDPGDDLLRRPGFTPDDPSPDAPDADPSPATVTPPEPPPSTLTFGIGVDNLDTLETEAGVRVKYHRTYFTHGASGALTQLVNQCKADKAAGRIPVVSFKVPNNNWANAADGTYDAAFQATADALVALDWPIITCAHHEPDNGDGTLATYKAMIAHLLPIFSVGKVQFWQVFTGYHQLFGNSEWKLANVYVNGVDGMGYDPYLAYMTDPGSTAGDTFTNLVTSYYQPFSDFAAAKGTQWGIWETGMNEQAALSGHPKVATWFKDMTFGANALGCKMWIYANSETILDGYHDWRLMHGTKRDQFLAVMKEHAPQVLPPPGSTIHSQDFEGIPVGNPISLANLRTALGDPALGDNPTMRGRMQIIDVGAPHEKTLRTTLQPNSTGGSNGVIFQARLARPVDHVRIDLWYRFPDGFPWEAGGKIPGFGGKSSVLSSVPAGGKPSWFGFSARMEWLTDDSGGQLPTNDEAVSYLYVPYLSYSSFGVERHGNLNGGLMALGSKPGNTQSNGTWHKLSQVIRINTVYGDLTKRNNDWNRWSNATEAQRATLAPSVVQGTDYLADGLHEVYFDDELRYRKTNEILRYYPDVHVDTLVWSQFRGGSGQAWESTSADPVDVGSIEITELS